jgi:hypothetical protein
MAWVDRLWLADIKQTSETMGGHLIIPGKSPVKNIAPLFGYLNACMSLSPFKIAMLSQKYRYSYATDIEDVPNVLASGLLRNNTPCPEDMHVSCHPANALVPETRIHTSVSKGHIPTSRPVVLDVRGMLDAVIAFQAHAEVKAKAPVVAHKSCHGKTKLKRPGSQHVSAGNDM